jgi:hypothetical protein
LALAGCGPVSPDPSEPDPNIALTSADVVGTWRDTKDSRTLTFG